jgi:hypothetical protein
MVDAHVDPSFVVRIVPCDPTATHVPVTGHDTDVNEAELGAC